MKFNIQDPTDNNPLLLNAIPTEHEGELALKVVFPEKDSITMIKKNGTWINATQTDINLELVKAIAQGIQLTIELNEIQQ